MKIIFSTPKKLQLSALIFLFVILQGCIYRIDRVNIEGDFNGVSKSYIYINKFEGDSLELIDSIKTSSKGHFEIKIKAVEPYFVTIGLNKFETPIILLVNPGEDLSIKSNNSNLSDYKVIGSNGSDLVRTLSLKLSEVKNQIDSLQKVYRSNIESINIDSIKNSLDSIYHALITNHRNFTYGFIKENTFSPVSILALFQSYDSLHSVFDYKKDRILFRLVDSTLLSVYSSNSMVKSFHEKVYRLDSLYKQSQKHDLMYKVGDILPNVGYPLVKGENLFISSIWFKYILIDFQGPWCELCKKNNAQLREIYNEYSPKGLVVIQVSLDVVPDSLRAKVLRDSLMWYNAYVQDIYKSKLLDTLKISSVPSSYITDRLGVIKATNLGGEKLRLKLKELFGQ